MSFCTNCGSRSPEGVAFCSNCGGPLTAAPVSPSVPSVQAPVAAPVQGPPTPWGKILVIVLVVILLLVSNVDIMGAYKNSTVYNILTWAITILIIALTVYMLYTQWLHPA